MSLKKVFIRHFLAGALLVVVLTLLMAVQAFAQEPQPNSTLALSNAQLWAAAAGLIAPALTYVINYTAPWTSEKVKALVMVVGAALAGAITQAINSGDVGFNDATYQIALTSVVAAVGAHFGFWKPSTLSQPLGGGRNKTDG